MILVVFLKSWHFLLCVTSNKDIKGVPLWKERTPTTNMMQSAVVVLLLSSLLCGAQENENNCQILNVAEKFTNMMQKMTLLETKLQNTEKEVAELRSMNQGTPKVAFSAALYESATGNTGPFTINTPLKYTKVFSNIGNHYNPATGIFTASVKGVYYFRFTMRNNIDGVPNSVVVLMKNNESVMYLWDTTGSDTNDSASNGVVITLEVGDNVYVRLPANRKIYDDRGHYNSFSGFLLFTI